MHDLAHALLHVLQEKEATFRVRRPAPHDVLQDAGLVLGHLQRASVLVAAELQRLAQLPESTLQAKINEVQRHPAKKLAAPAERALGIKGKKDSSSQLMRDIAWCRCQLQCQRLMKAAVTAQVGAWSRQLLRDIARAATTAPHAAGVTASKATELAVLRPGLSEVDINSMQGLIVQVGADASECKSVADGHELHVLYSRWPSTCSPPQTSC